MTTSVGCWARLAQVRGTLNQILIVILINVPTLSFGLALGWVSLASGEAGEGGGEASRGAVVAAVTTFVATLAGVPLSARALAAGRKLAIICTSGAFVVCWSLKLASEWGGPWCIVGARIAAGLGGAAAWALAPLLTREMCGSAWRGAAVAALALAHNAGVLLMYLAADARMPHRQVLWCCLGVAVLHCIVFFFMPESPSFLAAKGKIKEARLSLAWLRGMHSESSALDQEMATLPKPELQEQTPLKLIKEMLSDHRRRRAFIIGGMAVIGQESCGVLAILQYAERVFVLARDENVVEIMPEVGDTTAQFTSPSRHAVLLGAMQLVASAVALYLVERVGRRPLIVWCAIATGVSLAVATYLVSGAAGGTGSAGGAAIALAVAVAADSAGMQPAPYSLLADMFDYQYRGCALMLVTAIACLGNAIEVGLFPVVAAYGGIVSALGLAAGLTLAYAVFAALAIPETKDLSPEEIYDVICPRAKDAEDLKHVETKEEKTAGDSVKVIVNNVTEVTKVDNKETRCTRL